MRRMGLELLEFNYAVYKKGEIDIIARDGACLLFCRGKNPLK